MKNKEKMIFDLKKIDRQEEVVKNLEDRLKHEKEKLKDMKIIFLNN